MLIKQVADAMRDVINLSTPMLQTYLFIYYYWAGGIADAPRG